MNGRSLCRKERSDRRLKQNLAIGMLFFLCQFRGVAAVSLESTLRAASVPVEKLTAEERRADITSYAISTGDPFLLAYYIDDGSGQLLGSLHVMRSSRDIGDLRRIELHDVHAVFKGSVRMQCLGSALRIREYGDTVFVETHVNPSAGCVIVLSKELSFRTAISGSLLGLMGGNYAMMRASEVHFMAVHPLHIEVFDLERERSVEVYPPQRDGFRREYSRLIRQHVSEKWCMEHNAPCDPAEFDTNINGSLAINEASSVFGFEATFSAAGFGDDAKPRTVDYVFRQRGGRWQFRQFRPDQLPRRFGHSTIEELVRLAPGAAFESTAR